MLERLSCSDFRNLATIAWEPPAGTHLLLGANGSGKTSLLEAVYVLATTRSFRASRLAECCRHGRGTFGLSGRSSVDGRTDLAVAWSASGLNRTVNGKSSPLAVHLGALPVIAWTAADGEVVGGPPRARRRFLDQGLVGLRPGTLGLLSRYRQTLEQKRRLLASGGGDLGAWNELLAVAAAELIERRGAYVETLAAELREVLAGLDLPEIGLRYRPSPGGGRGGVEAVREALEAARRSELAARAPEVGPHRDELDIRWGAHGARRVASAGERKLLGLALTAARGRLLAARGRSPVYLLDDLDSELDSDRLRRIWGFFAGAGQLFASSNRPGVWEGLAVGSRWRLDAAGLHPG